MKKLEESKRTGENEGGGEQDERVRRKRGEGQRERRDSQSMKLFDNLVIYFLQSIAPEELAIKGDTQ